MVPTSNLPYTSFRMMLNPPAKQDRTTMHVAVSFRPFSLTAARLLRGRAEDVRPAAACWGTGEQGRWLVYLPGVLVLSEFINAASLSTFFPHIVSTVAASWPFAVASLHVLVKLCIVLANSGPLVDF